MLSVGRVGGPRNGSARTLGGFILANQPKKGLAWRNEVIECRLGVTFLRLPA